MMKKAAPELEEIWEQQDEWYSKAVQYWDKQEASVEGVLGGFGFVSEPDIADSLSLLLRTFRDPMAEAARGTRQLAALDCGAGIGRISEELLLHHFQEVDLIEPSAHLLAEARVRLTGPIAKKFPANHRAVNFFQMSLQDFTPEMGRYDIIWTQWCLMYLTDADVLSWLARCAAALKPGGLVVVKENICSGERFVTDDEDSSLTRSDAYLQELFRQSAMTLQFSQRQKNFPDGLLKVKMYSLAPRSKLVDASAV